MYVPKTPTDRGVHSHEFSHVGDQAMFDESVNPGVGTYFQEQIKKSMYPKESPEFLNQPSSLKLNQTIGGNKEQDFNEAEYLQDPSEVKARLRALRDSSIQQGYKLLEPGYDINKYKKGFNKEEQKQYDQLKSSGLSDDKINELMYLFAKNNTPNSVMAQKGAFIPYQSPRPFLRISPAGNAGYSDNTRVVTPESNLTDEDRDRIAQIELAKRRGTITQGKKETAYEKAKRKSSFVEQEKERTGSASPISYVMDAVNPATYTFAATDLVGNTGSAVKNAAQGNFGEAGSDLLNAGINALTLLPAAAEFKTPLKTASRSLSQTISKNLPTMTSRSEPSLVRTAIKNLEVVERTPVKLQPLEAMPVKPVGSVDLRRIRESVAQAKKTPEVKLPTVNRSGFSKESLQPNTENGKKLFSEISEEDFKNTVLTPKGKLKPYTPTTDLGLKWNPETRNIQLPDVQPLSTEEYTDLFNSNLGRLNEIISKNNKSGVQYSVKGLRKDGKLTFHTPTQTIGSNEISPQVKQMLKERGLLDKKGNYPQHMEEFVQRWSSPKLLNEGESYWGVDINPGKWSGTVEDVANTEYYKGIPGLDMHNTSNSVFADRIPRRGSGTYESINEYLKELGMGRVKPGFNSQTISSKGLWDNAIQKGKAHGFYGNPTTIYGSMRTLAPIGVGLGLGATNSKMQMGGMSIPGVNGSVVSNTNAPSLYKKYKKK
jgi:hypothetical protein